MAETPTNQPQTLPTDLERAIFEAAAHAYPLSILRFMLVAWRLKLWLVKSGQQISFHFVTQTVILRLEPLLYHTIVVGHVFKSNAPVDYPIFPTKLLHLIQPTPTRTPGNFVRHLLVPTTVNDARVMLSACRRIESLWTTTMRDGELFWLIEDLPLKQLCCNIQGLFGSQRRIEFRHRLFSKITHLELLDHYMGEEIWPELALIPRLTHICFHEPRFADIWLLLLRTCTSLRVLVVLDKQRLHKVLAQHWDEHALALDTRFVAMDLPPAYQDFTAGARTGNDYWSRAEDFIAKRRAGEIDRTEFSFCKALF
ncbi:hypothetical protein B0H19DRAFT_1228297 [Mycena capillaripes]|nr:hypothetical protein B0H19DRAFT_1228297 [Mycena capillaripes]